MFPPKLCSFVFSVLQCRFWMLFYIAPKWLVSWNGRRYIQDHFPFSSTSAFVIQFPFITLVKRRGRKFWVRAWFKDNSCLPPSYSLSCTRGIGDCKGQLLSPCSGQFFPSASLNGTDTGNIRFLLFQIFVAEYLLVLLILKKKILEKKDSRNMIVYCKWVGMNIGGIGKHVLKNWLGYNCIHSMEMKTSSAFMENYFLFKKLVMIFCFVLSK